MNASLLNYSIKIPVQLGSIGVILALIIVSMSGCAPTRQLYNEASIHYQKTGNFSDPVLDENRIADILFLVSTGYIQLRNEKQLSIYINCVTNVPRIVKIISGELIIGSERKVVAGSSGIDCVHSKPYAYPAEEGYQHGTGYFHFFGDELKNLIQRSDLSLKFEIEVESNRHSLILPIKYKVIWVWPT